MTVLAGGRVVTPTGVIDPGWVAVADDRIAALGQGRPPAADLDLGGRWLVPGFVDLHVHGGGGHSLLGGSLDEVVAGVAFHRAHGTTTTLVSLVPAPADDLLAGVGRLARWLDDDTPGLAGQVAGIHLEGPFLSRARCGALDPTALLDPDPDLAEALVAQARGWLRVMTVAPELPGAVDLVARLAAAGVVPAVGHTAASYEETAAAVRAGATLATHLGNAMGPFHHRAPGAVGACLAAPEVVCEVIADGHHLHPGVVGLVAAAKPGGMSLCTDAIAAAGAGDGRYRLGPHEVVVAGGVARLAGSGALAGSTLTMDRALAGAVAAGVDVVAASRAASATPARVLGLGAEMGAIEVGRRADLVVLDEALAPVVVLARGAVVHGAGALG